MKVFLRTHLIPALLLLLTLPIQAQLKVACIGDSITEGFGLKLDKGDSTYPMLLQEMLGPSYNVKNFGVSGKTMIRNVPDAYWTVPQYTQALQWEPDIVIIKLGTNDTKPKNWKGEAVFFADYTAFIQTFKSMPNPPKIYICYPIPVFKDGQFTISDGVMRQEVIPTVKLVGRKMGVEIIDLYSPMIGKQDLHPDGIHPIENGMRIIASEIAKVLTN